MFKKTDGVLTCENKGFYVSGRHQERGTALKSFAEQVETLSRLGCARIDTIAARSAIHSGYQVWPKFGYDGIVETAGPYQGKRIAEVYSTIEGQEWWKEHGESLELIFDMAPGSYSRKTLEAYKEFKLREARGEKVVYMTRPSGDYSKLFSEYSPHSLSNESPWADDDDTEWIDGATDIADSDQLAMERILRGEDPFTGKPKGKPLFEKE